MHRGTNDNAAKGGLINEQLETARNRENEASCSISSNAYQFIGNCDDFAIDRNFIGNRFTDHGAAGIGSRLQ